MGLEFSFVDETKDSMKQFAANFGTLSCMMQVIVCIIKTWKSLINFGESVLTYLQRTFMQQKISNDLQQQFKEYYQK